MPSLFLSLDHLGSDISKSYYIYDGYNRLTEFISDTTTAEYSYDLTGMRKIKTVNGETTRFVYRGGDIIGEVKGCDKTNIYELDVVWADNIRLRAIDRVPRLSRISGVIGNMYRYSLKIM